MPTDIRIIPAYDFIRATASGEFDFEMSKKALIEVASAATHLVNYRILLDVRKAQMQIPVADLYYLARELSNLGNAFHQKTAVLCSTERFDNAAFFALCAKSRGFRIQAFNSFEDAFDWLAEIEPHA
jgi:hypothetical protein